jgi:peptidoglycan/LPS O-acetylase OafA/YrhL
MSNKVHFKGLNGIRAIAAMIVLIFHIDQYVEFFGLKSIGFYKTGMAGYGVTLFFVLSGFLITRLLLIEQSEFQKIDLPKFYIRRILRIWPLYYLIILIAVIIYFTIPQMISYPEGKVFTTFFLYTFLLSNIGFGLGLGITPITPLWSVGVEEQFYVFWPFLLDKSKNVLKTLILLILVYFSIKVFLRFLDNDKYYSIIRLCCFDCMSIGGIGAYLVHNQSKFLKYLFSPFLQVISWSFLLISIFYLPIHLFSLIDNELHALIYLVIIINVSSNSKTLINLENKIFDFIGRISYGIYVYHLTIMIFLSLIFKHVFNFESTNSMLDYILVYVITITTTLSIAYFSFNYFESYFLRLKNKYSKIESVTEIQK